MSNDFARQLQALLEEKVEKIVDQVHDAALEVELLGINAMRHRIDAAETNWGKARQAGWAGPARPSAGRRETDEMYKAVTGETNRVSDTRIIIQWGWQNPEDYYFIQEHGSPKIEGMEALHYSLHIADDDLTALVRKI